jgi:hypothetical protein
MATTAQIRQALAANLAAIDSSQTSPYILANTTPPTLMVMPGPPGGGDFTEYHKAMGVPGFATKTFTVRCEVALNLDIGAQKKLDEYLDEDGDQSVFRAIESDKTLGDLVQDVVCMRSVAGLVDDRAGTSQKLAAEWEVVVFT